MSYLYYKLKVIFLILYSNGLNEGSIQEDHRVNSTLVQRSNI